MARLAPDDRKEQILDAALNVAERGNYRFMTREDVATEAGCSPALISAYLGTMEQVREHVMRAAVAKRRPRVVAQGLLAQDVIAQQAPDFLKVKAAEALA